MSREKQLATIIRNSSTWMIALKSAESYANSQG